jgi:phenylalanyl-tRNA synthetase, alpha subunit
MKSIKDAIKTIEKEGLEAIINATSPDALEHARITYLGRSGLIADLMGKLKPLSLEEKREMGPLLNNLKTALQTAYDHKNSIFINGSFSAKTTFDVTAYKPHQLHGSLHIYTAIINELSEIFTSMGYSIVDGPEVETSYYNFNTLNIPDDHPARDMHDTFWLLNPDRLLRTHTSSVQAHAMETTKPPFAIFAPGRVYRNEALDASHEFMFTQGEIVVISKDISIANLLATAQVFLQRFFQKENLQIRVRPGYFPFVEPGLEIDASCPFCTQGCSICKKTGWIELLGSGLVHPNVLRSSGIDPELYSGFALGFGIERLAMVKYGINDIRLFHSTNLEFLKQF